MRQFPFYVLLLSLLLYVCATSGAVIFSCDPANQAYRWISASAGPFPRYSTASEAISVALSGDGVIILADQYPIATTQVGADLLQVAQQKQLSLFIEYPSYLPNVSISAPRNASYYERLVVTSSNSGQVALGMAQGTLLNQNGAFVLDVQATAQPEWFQRSSLVLSTVAGYDSAVFGLPSSPVSLILFEPFETQRLLVCMTKISDILSSRNIPSERWRNVWQAILNYAAHSNNNSSVSIPSWTSSALVRPTYLSATEPLPANAIPLALSRAFRWINSSSGVLISDENSNDNLSVCVLAPNVQVNLSQIRCVMEGNAAAINSSGLQQYNADIRADYNAETAMTFAWAAELQLDSSSYQTASLLLDYVYQYSPAQYSNPNQSSYGLFGWGVSSPASLQNFYGDDNSRVLLSSILATSLLNCSKWDSGIVRGLLGNIRTTGQGGFRDAVFTADQVDASGWEANFNAAGNYTTALWPMPHFQSLIWAPYLWAFAKSGNALFLDRAYAGITGMMAQYPNWRWTEYISEEQAHMLLPLAWLARVKPSDEVLGWLKTVATDYLANQQPCGAVIEKLGTPGMCFMCPPGSNAQFGTGEAPLIQENGDACVDLLYSNNFAFVGLHEAAAAVPNEPLYKEASDNLASFMLRVQMSSEAMPQYDGIWYRGFDVNKWELWGSTSDWGWGPSAIESGWTQTWISTILALRLMNTSMWELTMSRSSIDSALMHQTCLQFLPAQYC